MFWHTLLGKAGVSGNELHIFLLVVMAQVRKQQSVSQWPRHAAKWMESMNY